MKFLNYEGLGHLISEFKGRFVQKVTGKDLSSNDFTNTLKQKLDGIESGAEVNTVNLSDLTAHTEATGNVHNIAKASTTKDGLMSLGDKKKLDDIEDGATTNTIEIIKRNGTVLDVDVNKTVDIDIPTKFSDLSNDKTYQTKSEIIGLISEHSKLKREVVTALPQVVEADDNTMYLVANESGGFTEYIIIQGAWEKLGDSDGIDLTGYLKTTDIDLITNDEIDTYLNA